MNLDTLMEDPHAWLENDSAERQSWITQQNAKTTEHLRIPGRERIRARLQELIDRDLVFPPSVHGNKLFYFKRGKDQKQPALYARDWPDGTERSILDPNLLSEDGSIAIADTTPSEDGLLLAYALTKDGSDWNSWHVLDLDTGERTTEMPRLAYTTAVWRPDNEGFYYSRSEHTDPETLTKTNQRIFFHKRGADWRHDEKIFGDGLDEDAMPGVIDISKDGRYVLIGVSQGYSEGELHLLDRNTGSIVELTTEKHGLHDAIIEGNDLYVRSNFEFLRHALYVAPLSDPMSWKRIIDPQDGAMLEEFSVLGDRIFTNQTLNVTSRLFLHSLDGRMRAELPLPTLGTATVPDGKAENNAAFFTFTSFTYPRMTCRYDLETDAITEFQSERVAFEPALFTTEQAWYASKDGTSVPMFITRRKDITLNGENPTILTGYGGFNSSETPYFSAADIAWLELGGIVALANLRGGGEFGEEWHRAGMLDKKQNVFDDFIAAGEALVGERPTVIDGASEIRRYTAKDRLGITGGSNGGLLVGAALVQRPDLWGAVDCEVPLLDMLKFHLTEGGKYWVAEYGSPDDPEHAKFLRAYSPYHNAKRAQYPPTLFQTSLGDDRGVDPMHAMKMAALVQERNTAGTPILLRVKTNTGHGHSKPVTMIVDESTDEYAFFSKHLGLRM